MKLEDVTIGFWRMVWLSLWFWAAQVVAGVVLACVLAFVGGMALVTLAVLGVALA